MKMLKNITEGSQRRNPLIVSERNIELLLTNE